MTMMCVRGYPDAQGRDMTQRSMTDRWSFTWPTCTPSRVQAVAPLEHAPRIARGAG
jgi:hypothetical protein